MKNWKKAAAALTALFALGLASGALADDITITVVDWNTGVASDLQKAACQEYMDSHPGIIIDHQTIPYDDYNTKLNTLIAAGETPDIFYASDMSALNYGNDGVSQDLVPFYEADGIDINEKFISPAIYGTDGKVYGLAYGVVSSVMYFNKAIFDEYVAPALDTIWIGESSVEDALNSLGESVMTVYQGRW